MAMHISRYAVAGTQRIVGEADHGDGLRALEQVGDGIGLGQRSHESLGVYLAYFLADASIFCLYIFIARLRIVSETSLLLPMAFRSAGKMFFTRVIPRSTGVPGS